MRGIATSFPSALRDLAHDDSGQGLVEYALILTFLALVLIATLTFTGQKAGNSLKNSANAVGQAITY